MNSQCETHNVAIMGYGGCGKSTIIRNYLHSTTDEEHIETVEECHKQRYIFDGRHCYVNFIDTAGSLKFPAMQELYIQNATGFILVYSITNRESFKALTNLWDRIKQVRTDYMTIPCVIIGNELDRENLREIETFEALTWILSEHLEGRHFELSGKNRLEIEFAFDVLFQQVGSTMMAKQSAAKKSKLKINQKNKKKAIKNTEASDLYSDLETASVCFNQDSYVAVHRGWTMDNTFKRPSKYVRHRKTNNKAKRKVRSFFDTLTALNCVLPQTNT